nr:hypothetical protein [Tanacetum cinerariifolium]
MDDPNITMEEYIRFEEEKAQKHRKVFNWDKYGKILYDEDVHDLKSVKTKSPAIALNDNLTSDETLSCEPTDKSSLDASAKLTRAKLKSALEMLTCRRISQVWSHDLNSEEAGVSKDMSGFHYVSVQVQILGFHDDEEAVVSHIVEDFVKRLRSTLGEEGGSLLIKCLTIYMHHWRESVYKLHIYGRLLLDDYKKGKKINDLQLIMYGDIFKGSNSYLNSRGSIEDFVSFRDMITSQLLYLRGSSYETLFVLSSLNRGRLLGFLI